MFTLAKSTHNQIEHDTLNADPSFLRWKEMKTEGSEIYIIGESDLKSDGYR